MRQAQLIIILGTNGTGKTTILKDLINDFQRQRKLIVTPDIVEWQEVDYLKRTEIETFTGSKKIVYRDNDFLGLKKNLTNSVLVLDDFKAYSMTSSAEKEALRSLCIRRRQCQNDIFIVAHGFTEIIPSYLLTFASKFILFKTKDNIKLVKNRLIKYQELFEAQQRINAHKNQHYFEIINC